MELISTEKLRRVFDEEVRSAGGCVMDVFDDGRRLFIRSVLPRVCEVQPKDRMQGGVAMRYVGDVVISPYLFREVCKNGAIWAHSLESTRIAVSSVDFVPDIRETVQACCAAEVFTGNMDEVRQSLNAPADRALMMMPMFSKMAAGANRRIVEEVIDLYLAGPERTGFALMNAVTATAREQSDPELRWNLEECGAAIPALLSTQRTLHDRAAKSLEEELLERFLHDEDRLAAAPETRDLAAVA